MRLIVRNLTKSISGDMILNRVSYSFEKGRVYGVCGRDASHRAVMLRCISGEERFERGYIRIQSRGEEHKIGFNDVALVYADSIFPKMLTGREFIKYYMDTHKVHGKSADEYLDLIELPEADRDMLIKGYSQAVINRLRLLCMYISAPEIILIEEPVSADEWKGADSLILELKRNHIVIISSGNFDRLKCICDELLILNDGVLCGFDSKHLGDVNEIDLLTVDLEENND